MRMGALLSARPGCHDAFGFHFHPNDMMSISHTRTRRLRPLFWFVMLVLFGPAVAFAADLPRAWQIDPAEDAALSKPAVSTDTVPGSNNVVDIIHITPDVWAATAKGPSRLTLPGDQWLTYDTTDGLPSLQVPAMGIFPNGAWSATSHTEVRDGRVVTWGDGLYRFNELSEEWERRTPSSDQASGPFQLAYDLAYARGRLFATCFAGGLLVSDDDGLSWENIFADGTARSDFENKTFNDLNNRYFAAVVDSTRPDSLALWAGTAYGINKMIFLTDTLKPRGKVFHDLYLDGARLYAATDDGMSRTPDRGGSWRTYNALYDGFPSDYVISTAAKGDTFWVGLASPDNDSGLGLAYSFNNGRDWTVTQPFHATGPGRRPRDIALTPGRVWVACEDGGMIYADMPGVVWENALGIDAYSLLPAPPDDPETVFIGTDVGIYAWPVAGPPLPGATLPIGVEADSIGQRVIGMGYQQTPCTTAFDSVIWALCEPGSSGFGTTGFAISPDGGETWDVSSRRLGVRDVVFEGCRYWLATDSGLAEGDIRNLDSLMFTASYRNMVNNKRIGTTPLSLAAEIGKDDLTGADVLKTLWVGTDSMMASSLDKGIKWGVVFSNPNPNDFDLLEFFRYRDDDTAIAGFEQLSGNFITAIGFQPGGRGTIWAATQATGQGRFANIFTGSKEKDGLSVTRDAGRTWSVPLTGHQIWNFAFDGAIVWAASSQGLLYSPDNGVSWDTINTFTDPETGAVIDSTTEVFAVELVGNEIWVGTANGMAILTRNGQTKAVRRGFKSVQPGAAGGEGGAYATPVPYSPNISSGGIRFHYTPPSDGPVTIKIYDYANNLVKTVTDGALREGGRQYDELDIWDGRNGEGEVVAVGTYFFVIEYSGGETHWGKLVVIP